jgi:hypothetical protein
VLAFTLLRTGNLWFAIGLHAAWDWAGSFFYGVSASGISFTGHLLNPSFRGSKWMTGGTVGPEASLITLLGYVVLLILVHFRFARRHIANPPRSLTSVKMPTRSRRIPVGLSATRKVCKNAVAGSLRVHGNSAQKIVPADGVTSETREPQGNNKPQTTGKTVIHDASSRQRNQ